ncbi:glucose 1,6-bisphosphate synthase isoform X2 [Pogoniulus pusillus]|uniref:glucose 1,6-bisphosphate synthase isoform X2 n=1 Tax=Pogoniulus pusillus TaxID=488313 RepID=UPI0030B99BFB
MPPCCRSGGVAPAVRARGGCQPEPGTHRGRGSLEVPAACPAPAVARGLGSRGSARLGRAAAAGGSFASPPPAVPPCQPCPRASRACCCLSEREDQGPDRGAAAGRAGAGAAGTTVPTPQLWHGRAAGTHGGRLQPHQRPHHHPGHPGHLQVPGEEVPRPEAQRLRDWLRHQGAGGLCLLQPQAGTAGSSSAAGQGGSCLPLLHLCAHSLRALRSAAAGGRRGGHDHSLAQQEGGQRLQAVRGGGRAAAAGAGAGGAELHGAEPGALGRLLGPAAGREQLPAPGPPGRRLRLLPARPRQALLPPGAEPAVPSAGTAGAEAGSALGRAGPVPAVRVPCRELNQRCQLRFVHSSFHGVGHHYVQEAFRAFGFVPPIPVPEQQCPDPNFSTLSCPNPEEGEAVLELSLRLAEQEGARVVLATDPDADRLAVAERQQDASWKVFSGNELAALFGWWLFSCWQQRAPPGASRANLYMLATTVSSKILRAIAQQEGFQFEETLPGFKWVGNRAQELLGMGMEVLFAFEESIGFMCGTSVLDKDGVSAAVVLAEMASFLHAQGLSLAQKLSQIYDRYGYHLSRTCYFLCQPGTAEGIFERLRNFGGPGRYPGHCSAFAILHLRDLARGYDSSQPGGKALPGGSQLLTFTFGNGAEASLRRSGTEPKLKLYAELCARPGHSARSQLEAELQQLLEALVEEFLQPAQNGLAWHPA